MKYVIIALFDGSGFQFDSRVARGPSLMGDELVCYGTPEEAFATANERVHECPNTEFFVVRRPYGEALWGGSPYPEKTDPPCPDCTDDTICEGCSEAKLQDDIDFIRSVALKPGIPDDLTEGCKDDDDTLTIKHGRRDAGMSVEFGNDSRIFISTPGAETSAFNGEHRIIPSDAPSDRVRGVASTGIHVEQVGDKYFADLPPVAEVGAIAFANVEGCVRARLDVPNKEDE